MTIKVKDLEWEEEGAFLFAESGGLLHRITKNGRVYYTPESTRKGIINCLHIDQAKAEAQRIHNKIVMSMIEEV